MRHVIRRRRNRHRHTCQFSGARKIVVRFAFVAVVFSLAGLAEIAAAQQSTTAPTSATAASQPTTRPGLKVGDAAPPLAVGRWIKGEPVGAFEPGHVYIVEFWATWCGPCLQAIPHLSQLQTQYAKDGLIVIGQDTGDDDPAKVESFVRTLGDRMNYRVAVDDLRDASGPSDPQNPKVGRVEAKWGTRGLPCAFLIDRQGRVAWIGHAMAVEPVLKAVLAGTFDVAAQPRRDAQDVELGNAMWEAVRKGDTPRALDLLRQVHEANPFADFDRIRMLILLADYDRSGDAEAALRLLDDLRRSRPDLHNEINRSRFDLLWKKKHDHAAASAVAAQIVDAADADPYLLNTIAWRIVSEPGPQTRDLDLAERAAERAVQLSGGTHGSIIDTLARVEFEKGNYDRAVDLQIRAVANAANDQMKSTLQATLEKYKAARAARPQ